MKAHAGPAPVTGGSQTDDDPALFRGYRRRQRQAGGVTARRVRAARPGGAARPGRPARTAPRLLAVLLLAALPACAGGDGSPPTADSGASASTAPAPNGPIDGSTAGTPPAPTGAGTATGSVDALEPGEGDEAASPFPADVGVDTAEPDGGPLTVVGARAARQAGYDRVVLELAGQPGRPGWRVEYVDEPRQEGSGDRVQVDGEAVLQVLVSGIGYPFDTGQQEETDDFRPTGTAVVREVVLGATYEGQYEAFVGVSARRPFRVFRLSDPARVVIDVQH